MSLQDKLEELKRMGNYAVSSMYGGKLGCDDMDVEQKDRDFSVVCRPVGCTGEVKILFIGTLSEFLAFDLKTRPKILNNPPKREEYRDGGYFIWGTDKGVKSIMEAPFHGAWKGVEEKKEED